MKGLDIVPRQSPGEHAAKEGGRIYIHTYIRVRVCVTRGGKYPCVSSYICHQTFHATVALIFDPVKNAPGRTMIIDTRSWSVAWNFLRDDVGRLSKVIRLSEGTYRQNFSKDKRFRSRSSNAESLDYTFHVSSVLKRFYTFNRHIHRLLDLTG